MSLLDQLKKNAEAKKFSGRHPLLKMSAKRDVRDAYFQGVVFAAFVDDNKVDAEERRYLEKLGAALNFLEADVSECIDFVGGVMGKSESEQSSFVIEIAEALKSPEIAKLFLAEFALVWTLHATNAETNLQEWCSTFVSLWGLEVPEGWLTALAVAVSSGASQRIAAIEKLKCFDKDALAYLFGDVSAKDAQEKEKQSPKSMNDGKDAFVQSLVDMVSRKSSGHDDYDVAAITKLANDAGIKEHVIPTILKLLLPKAQHSFAAFCRTISNLKPSIGLRRGCGVSEFCMVSVDSSPHGRLLLNYLRLFDVLTTCSPGYGLLKISDENTEIDSNNGSPNQNEDAVEVSPFSFSWKKVREKDMEDAYKAIEELYRRMLAEFEFRSTF